MCRGGAVRRCCYLSHTANMCGTSYCNRRTGKPWTPVAVYTPCKSNDGQYTRCLYVGVLYLPVWHAGHLSWLQCVHCAMCILIGHRRPQSCYIPGQLAVLGQGRTTVKTCAKPTPPERLSRGHAQKLAVARGIAE